MKNVLLIILAILIAKNDARSQEGTWINYTNGLYASFFAEDSNYYWVGALAWGSLLRMNKSTKEITHYNKANSGLNSNFINDIVIDSNQNVWIGQPTGLVKFDHDQWVSYDRNNSDLPYNHITALASSPDSTLFFACTFDSIVDGQLLRKS